MEAFLQDSKAWVALSFLVFMLGFIRYALPAILRGLDSRSDAIKTELDEAVKLREAAQALLSEYQQKHKAMQAEAEQIIALAKQEATAMRKHAEDSMRESVERRTKQAHDKIARAEADALADVQSRIVELSLATTRELLASELDDAQRSKLAESAIDDIKRQIH